MRNAKTFYRHSGTAECKFLNYSIWFTSTMVSISVTCVTPSISTSRAAMQKKSLVIMDYSVSLQWVCQTLHHPHAILGFNNVPLWVWCNLYPVSSLYKCVVIRAVYLRCLNQIYLHLLEICLVLSKAISVDKTGFTNNPCHLFYLNSSVSLELLSISVHNIQRQRISLCDTYQT